MRTNVVLDEGKVAILMRLSGAKSKTAAVARAVDEQIRREKLGRLAALLGRVDVDEAAIAALRDAARKEIAAFGEGQPDER
jgi:hypothetical protein